MEFETVETQMIFDDNGKIERIEEVHRNDAHKLIEECMLAANVCAADFLLQHKHNALYRNHAGPTPEKLAVLREQLALLGLRLGGGDKPEPKHYGKLAEQIAERPDREALQSMLLRSMQQAVYEAENEGHFGLAYDYYTHFTSPIRRYPDLLVHRAIKAVLANKTYNAGNWQELGAHCSYCERRADEASRDVENWLKTYFMRDKVGEVFAGKISGMANFGIFVTLDDIHVEGMVHVSDLGEDYFNYHPETLSMIGERSGVQFKMGDRVVIKVARADLDTSKIDLVLVSGGESRSSRKAKKQAANDSGSLKKARGKQAAETAAAPIEGSAGKKSRKAKGSLKTSNASFSEAKTEGANEAKTNQAKTADAKANQAKQAAKPSSSRKGKKQATAEDSGSLKAAHSNANPTAGEKAAAAKPQSRKKGKKAAASVATSAADAPVEKIEPAPQKQSRKGKGSLKSNQANRDAAKGSLKTSNAGFSEAKTEGSNEVKTGKPRQAQNQAAPALSATGTLKMVNGKITLVKKKK